MLRAPGSHQYFLQHSLAQGSQFKDLQEVEGDKTKFATCQLISGKREALSGKTKIVDTTGSNLHTWKKLKQKKKNINTSLCCFRW